jgi:hypothetical protein
MKGITEDSDEQETFVLRPQLPKNVVVWKGVSDCESSKSGVDEADSNTSEKQKSFDCVNIRSWR